MTKLRISLWFVLCSLAFTVGSEARADKRLFVSDDPYNLRISAFQCYIEGQTETALETYQRAAKRAIQEYGDDSTVVADIYFEMGSLAFDAGKENTAESCLNEALKRNPNSEMARIKLAEIYRIRSKSDQALVQIQTCLRKNKSSIAARRALVQWLQEKGFVALATQESYVLSQIAGGLDKRIAPPSTSTQLATAIGRAQVPQPLPQPKQKKEESAPKIEKPVEAKRPTPVIAPPKAKPTTPIQPPVVAAKKITPPPVKKKEPPAPKPTVAVIQPKKTPPPEVAEEKKESEEKPEVVVKVTPPKRVEKPAPKFEPPAPVVAKRSRNGLVPPPPPIMPAFGMPMYQQPPQFNNLPLLQTSAKITKAKAKADAAKEAAKEAVKEKPKELARDAAVDDAGEGDFLIDWAATSKKKKKTAE